MAVFYGSLTSHVSWSKKYCHVYFICILQDERNESEQCDAQIATFSPSIGHPDDSSAPTELVAHGHDKPCR